MDNAAIKNMTNCNSRPICKGVKEEDIRVKTEGVGN